jgi:hypothetical protein
MLNLERGGVARCDMEPQCVAMSRIVVASAKWYVWLAGPRGDQDADKISPWDRRADLDDGGGCRGTRGTVNVVALEDASAVDANAPVTKKRLVVASCKSCAVGNREKKSRGIGVSLKLETSIHVSVQSH